MQPRFQKLKKILAVLTVSFLLILYAATLVSAILARPEAHGLFMGCLAATIVLPVMLYILLWRMFWKVEPDLREEKQKDEGKSKRNRSK